MKRILIIMAGLCICWLPAPTYAQTSSFDNAFAPRGSEARLSFTIPIGESSKSSKTAPRLELGLRRYSERPSGATDWMLESRPNFTEARLGFTLNDTPDFLLNDQVFVLSAEDEQANIGTPGRIGLGVGAVVVAAVVLVGALIIACASSDEGCYGGDE